MLLYANSILGHIGSFQIPLLGSCPQLTDWKISLISSVRLGMRCVFQSDMDTSSSFRYWFITIWFQMNHYCSSKEKANFIHIQGATDYMAQEWDLREEKSINIYSAKLTTNYLFISSSSRFCPSLIGLAECAGEERGAMAEVTVCK